jgi:hypothetical protein
MVELVVGDPEIGTSTRSRGSVAAMSKRMRWAPVSPGLFGNFGCAFFDVADIDEPVPPKKEAAAPKAGTGGGSGAATTAGTGGTGAGAGGQAGM